MNLDSLTFSPFKDNIDLTTLDFLLSPEQMAKIQNEYVGLAKQKVMMVAPTSRGPDLDAYLYEQHTLDGKLEMITTIVSWHNLTLQLSGDKGKAKVASNSNGNVNSAEFARAAQLVDRGNGSNN